MSIAVRVSVWILGVLVLVSAGVAVWALLQKQTLQDQNQRLNTQITSDGVQLADLQTKVKKLKDDADQLNAKVSQTQQDRDQFKKLSDDLKQQSDELKQTSSDLKSKLDQASSDRDEWKSRVATISRERDDLMQKLKNRPTKIVYKDQAMQASPAAGAPAVDVTSAQGDQYWASVLKQKAALQVELEKENSELNEAALQVVSLKKQNSDLDGEVKQLSVEKDDISQKIKYGQDLADNLAVDLARSRNDQQTSNSRVEKLKDENAQLLSQIRGLSSAKLQLEQTVARLTDDKDAMQKKLIETESVIQSRIDDIWKIKEGLDKKLSENAPSSSSGSTELPPIVVNASNDQQQPAPASPAPAAGMGKTQGSVISINEANNFVIIDLGQQNSPVSVGNSMKVYRDSNEIATLEVIQVRRDICAADIKGKSTELRVGDIVKLN